jgi:ketosteroid isomerase-like protein
MKTIVALAGSLFLLSASAACAGDAGIESTLKAFGDAFNKGDMKAARALHVAAPVIIDEVPPHLWTGANAFDSWGADLGKSEAAEGRSGGQVTIGAPTREVISGDRAYVIVPTTYAFTQKGRMMRETAQMTLALEKDAGGAWKIASWTWTGPEAKPVK